jgi:hypothetical protein
MSVEAPPSPPGFTPVAAQSAEAPRWSPAPPRPRHERARRSRAFGPAVETELGGIFYLLNFALYLRLYGDEDNLPLSPWELIELLGRRLLDDARSDTDPVWPLLAALAGRDEHEPAGAHFSPPDTTLDIWLALLVWHARERLRLALGLPTEEDSAPLLLYHHARVHVTDTHVDIVLSLETLPIEIRLAGLDRDPGWVAAAGRFVAFHFE